MSPVEDLTLSTPRSVLTTHGISEVDLDITRDDDPDDRLWCPLCNHHGSPTGCGLSFHCQAKHDCSPMEGVIGNAIWRATLEELHCQRYFEPYEIAADMPTYVGQASVTNDLKRYDLYVKRAGSSNTKGGGKILARMTVEEFDAHLAARREGRPSPLHATDSHFTASPSPPGGDPA